MGEGKNGVGFWWWIIGIVVGLIIFWNLAIKFCTFALICPYCRRGFLIGKGVVEFGEKFECYWCKRELDPKDFAPIRKGKRERGSKREL